MDAYAHARAEERYRGGWLCPSKADRLRLTDATAAVRRARMLAAAFCGLGLIALGPWRGWAPVGVFVIAPVAGWLLDRLLARAGRPERVVAMSLAVHTALILVGIAITGGVRSPMLPWVAIPVVTAAARFRLLVFLAGSALVAVVLTATAAVVSPVGLAHDPTPLIGTIVLVAALVVAQQPLLSAEMRWRREAVLDPLTGLLNRQGLERRFREVAEQARVTQRPVALLVLDLDHFKCINDAHGHAHGDAVLKEVAYVLRKELRSYELLYRIGGEELLLILPGSDLEVGCAIAEQARQAIAQSQPGGQRVTASFGVCAAEGDGIELEAMFRAADRCLYEAKAHGRNLAACMPTGSHQPQLLSRTASETALAA